MKKPYCTPALVVLGTVDALTSNSWNDCTNPATGEEVFDGPLGPGHWECYRWDGWRYHYYSIDVLSAAT